MLACGFSCWSSGDDPCAKLWKHVSRSKGRSGRLPLVTYPSKHAASGSRCLRCVSGQMFGSFFALCDCWQRPDPSVIPSWVTAQLPKGSWCCRQPVGVLTGAWEELFFEPLQYTPGSRKPAVNQRGKKAEKYTFSMFFNCKLTIYLQYTTGSYKPAVYSRVFFHLQYTPGSYQPGFGRCPRVWSSHPRVQLFHCHIHSWISLNSRVFFCYPRVCEMTSQVYPRVVC